MTGTAGTAWLQPRDPAVAARTVAVLCAVAAAVTIVFAVADPSNHPDWVQIVVTVVIAAAVIAAGWSMKFAGATHPRIWALCPFIAVVVIVALDLLTSDGSVAGQVFFVFPALYAASQLRWPAALCISAITVAGEIAVVVVELPLRLGLTDAVYVCSALLTTVVLLVVAGERQDALIAQLKRQAAIDPLTGLATRRVLDHAAQSALSTSASGDGTALILLDVDDFKSVNDRYGHPGGDEVLIRLARLLADGCREGDIVSRMGGDEIAVLLPGCSLDTVARRADQIMWDVRATEFRVTGDQTVSISVSAGLAHAPTHAVEVQALYAAADAALYEAKRAGRNRIGAPPTPDRVPVS